MNENIITSSEASKIVYHNKNMLQNCTIEIINSCIFRCDHCYMPDRKKQIMSFDTYKKIVDELYDEGCLWILLTGGETLLHPDFEQFYIYVKEKGFLVSINTNGYLINNKILKLFAIYKPHVIEISLYGYDNRSYENFTHYKNAFTKINSNIDKLLNNKINVSLKTVLTKSNYTYIKQLKEYAKSKNISFRYDYIIFPKIDGKNRKVNERLSTQEVMHILKDDKNACTHFQSKIDNIFHQRNDSTHIFECTGGEDGIYIDSFGNINMCVIVTNQKYNIKDYHIKEIRKKFIKFKKKYRTNANSCKDCLKKSLCRYCSGRFMLENGSYEKAPKWYCEMANDIIYNFDSKNKLYTNQNKIPENILLEMFQILTKNMEMIDQNFTLNDDDFNIWKSNILNSDNLNTYIKIENEECIGYIQFVKDKLECSICEIQIDDKHKKDHITFRKLMEAFVINCNIKNNSIIYCHINPKNLKSKEVFTKIGFKNKYKNKYEITGYGLLNWIYKKN